MDNLTYGIWIIAAGLAAMDAQVEFGGHLSLVGGQFCWERSGGMGTVCFDSLELLDEFLWGA